MNLNGNLSPKKAAPVKNAKAAKDVYNTYVNVGISYEQAFDLLKIAWNK